MNKQFKQAPFNFTQNIPLAAVFFYQFLQFPMMLFSESEQVLSLPEMMLVMVRVGWIIQIRDYSHGLGWKFVEKTRHSSKIYFHFVNLFFSSSKNSFVRRNTVRVSPETKGSSILGCRFSGLCVCSDWGEWSHREGRILWQARVCGWSVAQARMHWLELIRMIMRHVLVPMSLQLWNRIAQSSLTLQEVMDLGWLAHRWTW